MALRPKLLNTGRRPSSAIFLGGNTPPALPDPPRTPSPEDDDDKQSGLPSPPATNRSGSTGDNTTNAGSVRRRSIIREEDEEQNMAQEEDLSATYRPHSRGPSVEPYEEEEFGNDEEHTARFTVDRRRSMPTENSFALQRIKDLNERSKMVSSSDF
jgi:hypothetical protein